MVSLKWEFEGFRLWLTWFSLLLVLAGVEGTNFCIPLVHSVLSHDVGEEWMESQKTILNLAVIRSGALQVYYRQPWISGNSVFPL